MTCAARCATRDRRSPALRPCATTPWRSRIAKETDLPTALAKLRELSQPLGGIMASSGQRSLRCRCRRWADPPHGTEAAITERIRQTIEQSIQIVERRINQLGTVEPLIQRQGIDRILVQVPGCRIRPDQEDPRQDRQAGIPHGRSTCRWIRRSRQRAAGFRSLTSSKAENTPYVIEKQVWSAAAI